MSTLAKLLARKQALLERLESHSGPNEREEIERLLAQIETALSLLAPRDPAGPEPTPYRGCEAGAEPGMPRSPSLPTVLVSLPELFVHLSV